MSTQIYRIVNLDKKQVLDPKLMGSSRRFEEFAFTESPTMGGLLWLLNGDWSGDRVAIIGNRAEDSDLPIAKHVCGIPASQLCFPTLHGHERFKNVSRKTREALTTDYDYRFQVMTYDSDDGRPSSSVQHLLLDTLEAVHAQAARDNAWWPQPPFVVINRNRGEFIKSDLFSSRPGLDQAITNFWKDDASHSWLPTAVAVLLTASMDEDDDFFVEHHTGSWAGDNISIEILGTADLEGLHDLSGELSHALISTDAIDDLLTPHHEESSPEDDDSLGPWPQD